MSVQILVEGLDNTPREHGLRFLCKLLALKLAQCKKIDGRMTKKHGTPKTASPFQTQLYLALRVLQLFCRTQTLLPKSKAVLIPNHDAKQCQEHESSTDAALPHRNLVDYLHFLSSLSSITVNNIDSDVPIPTRMEADVCPMRFCLSALPPSCLVNTSAMEYSAAAR